MDANMAAPQNLHSGPEKYTPHCENQDENFILPELHFRWPFFYDCQWENVRIEIISSISWV